VKIFISADIEGTAGITVWTECEKGKPDYEEFRKQMTAEVVAACEGAIEGGAKEIIIKDAHDTARNIIASKLPESVKLIREWSGHPFGMVQGLDESFDAAIFTGYHSRAGSDTNPLAHTLTGSSMYIKINDRFVSEFLISSYSAAYVGVPVVMITGDKGICEEAKEVNPGILTVHRL
jgi:D-amino peptidase